MSDVYIPGVRSRFNSEKLVEDLMTIERVPRDRVQKNIDTLQLQKGYWREVGDRITSLRDSSRLLFSFQNPFNDRIVRSGDESVISAIASREAIEQSMRFTVKQIALADRFLSQPLDEKMRVEAGTYKFTVGSDEISINYRGGLLRDFVDVINRQGRDKIGASLISVQAGTRSLLIEAKQTGEGNRLGFSGDMINLSIDVGMMTKANETPRTFPFEEGSIRRNGLNGNTANAQNVIINDGAILLKPQTSASLPINVSIGQGSTLVLRLQTQTKVEIDDIFHTPAPPSGPGSVSPGSATYGGITIENAPSSTPTPEWRPPAPPVRSDNMSVLTMQFSDGSSISLPPITDSTHLMERQYQLADIAVGRTITSLTIENSNTHREVSVAKVEMFDPMTSGGLRPTNAVSKAQDAIVTMEGIEIKRASNSINDLIPGVTLNVRNVSDRPVELNIRADIQGVKDAVISFVGNYNLLMAEINVLTRRDERLITELTYLTSDEADAMRERLGIFSSDTTLNTLRNSLQRTVSAPYPTSMERDLTLLAQIGISTNSEGGAGYDPSRLRGYLQINEKTLDLALETKIPAIKELFAFDTTGDLLADTGVAYNVDALISPFIGTGGIITLKTNTLDSRISQDERRIVSLDRALSAKEQELRIQYARMEAAYARMEQMTTSLDNFSRQSNNNNR